MQKTGQLLLGVARYLTQLRAAYREVGSWKDFQAEFAVRLPALLYHRVGPPQQGTPPGLTVSPARFERHVRWLARRGFRGIRTTDWLRWVREGTPLPKKPVLLTFDDAYGDTAEYALPILRKYGFSGAVYVVTERLGRTNTWDEILGRGTLQLMTADQIRYWAAQGIDFGAHSRTHPRLTKLTATELSAEVVGSKNDLSSLLGHPVVTFAYPYGDYDDAARDLVRTEFDLALSVEEGLNSLSDDLHLLRRAYIAPDCSLIEFALSVRWGGTKRIGDWRQKLALRTRLKRALGIGSHQP